MIIYPLPAKELDDKTLSCQIKNVAQVLCNVDWLQSISEDRNDDEYAPLKFTKKFKECPFTKWTAECSANFDFLVKLGLECCEEWIYRFKPCVDVCSSCDELNYQHKSQSVIEWAASNKPDLPCSADNCRNGITIEYRDSARTKVNNNATRVKCPFYDLTTPFPICVPNKYIARDFIASRWPERRTQTEVNITKSYCNYYREKLVKSSMPKAIRCESNAGVWTSYKEPITPLWSRREKPEYLK